MNKLQALREKLKQAEQRQATGGGDNTIYPFWNLKESKESVIRFLPDADDSNSFFWVERLMIKLPFSGVRGESESRDLIVQVPCMEMYGETCPILSEVRTWFKDPASEDLGKKYWKKRSYFFQGFVVEDGLDEKEPPENPIRKFVISTQIYNIIKSSLMDPELEDLPTDFVNGLDFRLRKSTKGKFADYSTSTWGRRERPLSKEELAAIEQFGLFDLSSLKPKKPGKEEIEIIKEMFEASVNGEPYDAEQWAKYYKPFGLETTNSSAEDSFDVETKAKPVTKSAPVIARKPEPEPEPEPEVEADYSEPEAVEVKPKAGESKAQDILKMIRSRNQK